jgi:hypothetical protein
LSGCAVDPYYDNQDYSQGYNQPTYQSQRYRDTNTQGNYYYNSNSPNRQYTDRLYYYQSR